MNQVASHRRLREPHRDRSAHALCPRCDSVERVDEDATAHHCRECGSVFTLTSRHRQQAGQSPRQGSRIASWRGGRGG